MSSVVFSMKMSKLLYEDIILKATAVHRGSLEKITDMDGIIERILLMRI